MGRKKYLKQHIVSCTFVLGIFFGAIGCGRRVLEEKDFCHLVLEEGEGFCAEKNALTVERGGDAAFEIMLEDGYQLQDVKYGEGRGEENRAPDDKGKYGEDKGEEPYVLDDKEKYEENREEKNRASDDKGKYGEDREEAHATDYTVKYDGGGQTLTLTLYDVRYSETVQVHVKKSDVVIRYHANGGRLCGSRDRAEAENEEDAGGQKAEKGKGAGWQEAEKGEGEDGQKAEKGEGTDGQEVENGEEVSVAVARSHLRPNTSIGTDLFERPGYTQIGWNTEPDGSGIPAGLGSRVDWREGMALYAQWVPWTKSSCFRYEEQGEFAAITGFDGQEDTICIPPELDGRKVRRIRDGAFAGAHCSRVILPPGIYEVESGAFQSASLKELYLYDDISRISDHAFTGCGQFQTLHINAALPPVYSGNYFDTFQDKYDRLLQLKDRKKIVLFSGSSTRFGYDSAMIDEAFEEYEVVNMGVFAYTPALPQLCLILDCMQEGDILLHSPEFDASNRQFCEQKSLDYATFAMMESNYDAFAQLDIRDFEQVFTAWNAYNAGREGMEKKNYGISASHYDEDGVPVEVESYNQYGDYCLYRPNSSEDQPIYGLPVHYTVNAFPKEKYIEPLNAVYGMFLEKGAEVYFTYSPRNKHALSEDSTQEERERLHEYFQEHLAVPVITDLEDSLVSGVYLYGTDNHLSTEGVEIRTRQVIEALKIIRAGK